jgi:uncharacterized protein (DUF433 family)
MITIDQDICNGNPVFEGTRITIATMFDYLRAGLTIPVFLEDFPSITKQHAVYVFEHCRDMFEFILPTNNNIAMAS